MATVIKQLAFVDGGAFILSFAYDDVTFEIIAFTAENTSARNYQVTATSTSTQRRYEVTCTPGTIEQNIPPGAANRLQLSVTPSGKLDGVEWSIS